MTAVWFALVLLCMLMYVVLDGYDLGVGIATLFERDPVHRHEMLETVALAWDGNETWLVLLGVCLWAGFPAAFGMILPHACVPLTLMLFALIVRGVSLEMASQRPPAPGWERAFGIGSLVAALAQGAAAGTLATNLTAGGGLGRYSALTAITVPVGYLALGYAFTTWKASGSLRFHAGRRGVFATLAAVALVAACLAAVETTAAPLDLGSPARIAGFVGLLIFAVAGVILAVATLRPASRRDGLPLCGLAIGVVATVLAVVTARYPVLAPPSLTVYNAVSPSSTMRFLAIGVGLNVPLVLFYSWYAHYAFRGAQRATPESRDAAPLGDH